MVSRSNTAVFFFSVKSHVVDTHQNHLCYKGSFKNMPSWRNKTYLSRYLPILHVSSQDPIVDICIPSNIFLLSNFIYIHHLI